MADFDPPFGWDAERRAPTSDEIQTGIGCGPFQLPMWNWLFWSLWSELGEVITHAGLTPDNGDMTQVRQAIQAMIDASTGDGETESYLTLLQASARLPIFPEVQNSNGHFGVTASTGQVTVPAGVSFLHRGISPYTTVLTNLATDASKTYHLRWNKTDGFALKDLTSGTYNPTTAPETDARFDSTFDDMLVARVITNSSNVPTVTNLINRNILRANGEEVGAGIINGGSGFENQVKPSEISSYKAVNLNFARTPDAFLTAINDLAMRGPSSSTSGTGEERNIGVRALSRYQVAVWGQGETDLWVGWTARA